MRKNLCKLFFVFCALILNTAGYAQAQEETQEQVPQTATASIMSSQLLEVGDETALVELVLKNTGQETVSDLRYAVILLEKLSETSYSTIHRQINPDVFSLASGEGLAKHITYNLPKSFRGEYVIGVEVGSTTGVSHGLAHAGPVTLEPSPDVLTIYPDTCNLTVEGTDEIHPVSSGIDFDSNEKVFLNCDVENFASKGTLFTPEVKVTERTVYGLEIDAYTAPQDSLEEKEKKTVSVEIKKPTKAQAYTASVNYRTGAGESSNIVEARFVVRGASSTINTINLDKEAYNSGDLAGVRISISGAAHIFPGARGAEEPTETELKAFSNQMVQTQIFSSETECAEIQLTALRNMIQEDTTFLSQIPITTDCPTPRVEVAIFDEAGQLINSQQSEIESTESLGGGAEGDEEVNNPAQQTTNKMKSESTGFKKVVAGVVAFSLVLALVVLILRRRKGAGMVAFLGMMIVSGALLTTDAQAESANITVDHYRNGQNTVNASGNFTAVQNGNCSTQIRITSDIHVNACSNAPVNGTNQAGPSYTNLANCLTTGGRYCYNNSGSVTIGTGRSSDYNGASTSFPIKTQLQSSGVSHSDTKWMTVSLTCGDPDCTRCDSDPDGDGWGWENGKTCKMPPGLNCPEPEECGNGVIEGSEQCDDGNTNNNDSCNNSCRTMPTCGSAQGNSYTNEPSNSEKCSRGSVRQASLSGNTWSWKCEYGGQWTPTCSATRIVQQPACGYADGGTNVTAQPNGTAACASGSSLSNMSGSGTSSSPWTWRCNRGGNNTSCNAYGPTPISCGSANNSSGQSSQPSGTQACNPAGSFSDRSDTSTHWRWSCGSNNCQAEKEIDPPVVGPACGSVNQNSKPTASQACSEGTPSNITGDGSAANPWTWTCSKNGITTNPVCQAQRPATDACGPRHMTTTTSQPSGSQACTRGAFSDTSDTSTQWRWDCGSASCYSNKQTIQSPPLCGTDSGTTINQPTSWNLPTNPCIGSDTPNWTTASGSFDPRWTCTNAATGLTSLQCQMTVTPTASAACGPMDGQHSLFAQPTTGLCTVGTPTPSAPGISTDGLNWEWSCVSGSSSEDCSAIRNCDEHGYACGNECRYIQIEGNTVENFSRDGGVVTTQQTITGVDPTCIQGCDLYDADGNLEATNIPLGSIEDVDIVHSPVGEGEVRIQCRRRPNSCTDEDGNIVIDPNGDDCKPDVDVRKSIKCVCSARRCTSNGQCVASPVFGQTNGSSASCSNECETNADCGGGGYQAVPL